MAKSIDGVLEIQQRDKMGLQLGSIERAVDIARDLMGREFVPLDESAFDSVHSLLNTARLCIDSAVKEFDKWLKHS